MATEQNPIRYTNFDGLMNTGASYFTMKDDELYACKNCYRYKSGLLEKVPGYEKEDANQFVSDKPVSFLHYYFDTANDDNYLLCGSEDTGGTSYSIKYLENLGSTASSGFQTLTGSLTTDDNSVYSAVNYLGAAYLVGYNGNGAALNIPMRTVTATTMALVG